MSATASPTGAGRRWTARATALLVLAAVVLAVVLIVDSVHAHHDVTQAQAASAMAQLASANQALSSQLSSLRTGESPKPAQSAARGALSLTHKLSADIGSGGDLGAALDQVFTAEAAYLDAVGSSLNNPRSVLLGHVVTRAQALRDALQDAPGATPKTVAGATALVAYSHSRNHG